VAFNKEKVMDAARKFVDKGQVDKAIKEYLRVVKEDPQDVRVWLKIGDLYAKKGSKQEASETYLKVARFYQDQGFFLKAVAVYKQILKLDPRLVEVNLKLAELYRQLGLLSDAMQHFESVAAHFHREGKTKEALATVRQLVDLDPENIATRIKLAELYSKESMTAEAVAEFQVACDQLRKQNRVDDFVKVAERLLWHKADSIALNRELAVLYLRRNDPRRALQKLQACFKSDPRDVETLALLAQAFQALDQKSKTVSVLKELARVFDENKERPKAEEVHRKILQFVPSDPDSTAYLGNKASRPSASPADKFKPVITPPGPVATGRGTGAQPRLGFTTELAAVGGPEVRMTGAMPLVEAADFGLPVYDAGASGEVGAAADFSEDLEAGSFDGNTGSVAGEVHAEEIDKILTETDVYIKYGLHQKAIDHLRRVFALDPENLEARERLKDVLISQGREREAVVELMKLAEATAQGDPDRAETYLREVLGLDGTHKPAFELARRYKLELGGRGGEAPAGGGVAPIDDELDFDDLDFNDSQDRMSARAVGLARNDSFDGIDPSMFAARGGSAADRNVGDKTRQVAASEVEVLAAMSSAPHSLEFEEGVVETPPPKVLRGAAWSAPARSLDDVLDDHLDDALGDDIDQDVAAELAGGSPPGGFANTSTYDFNGFDEAPEPDAEFELPPASGDEDLPFDPAAARAFDLGLRPSGAQAAQLADAPPTFDPAAAAAFDADGPGSLRYRNPSAEDLGAAPAERFDSMGFGKPLADTTRGEADVPDEFSYEAGAASDDGGHTVDAPAPVHDDDQAPAYVAAPRPPSSLEDDLDEVDFYVSQDMMVEAADLLRTLLDRHPGHPLITAKLRDIDPQAAGYAAANSGPVAEVDSDAIEDEQAIPAPLGDETIDSDEIEELDADDVEELSDSAVFELPGAGDQEVVRLDAAPREPKKKKKPAVVLEKPIDDSDAETHYDLGLAYKEMGLHDEAVKAFEKVTGNPQRMVQCQLMIGLCRRDQGAFSEAIHAFKAGLHAPQVTEREKQSLFYEIGVTYEAMGDAREALYYFEMVTKRDPSFLDAGDRASRLRNGNGGLDPLLDEV